MDYMIRGTAAQGQIRAFGLSGTQMVETARGFHKTSPLVTAALGRLLIAASMMGADLKNETDLLTVTIRSGGPLSGMTVTSDSRGRVRGYAFENEVELPLNSQGQFDVAEALGLGVLSVVKDIGLKEPYIGQTHLITSEIGDDIAYYYLTSEQIPCVVALGVLIDADLSVKAAGGFMIQLMPGASEEVITLLEERVKKVTGLSQLLEQGHSPEMILDEVLQGLAFKVLQKEETGYYCNCSKHRVEKVLLSMGKKELAKIIEEEEVVEVCCHYCDQVYHFDKEELMTLLFNGLKS